MFFLIWRSVLVYSREGNGTPLQHSCLENPMDGGAWWAAVHGVAKSRTWLSDFTFTFHFHALEKEMATYFCVLSGRIPGTGEPGGLPFMGSHRVRHYWSDLAAAAVAGIFSGDGHTGVGGIVLISCFYNVWKSTGCGIFTSEASLLSSGFQGTLSKFLLWYLL